MHCMVRCVHKVCLLHCDLRKCCHLPRSMLEEMLDIHLEVVMDEVAEMLKKFVSQLGFCGKREWHLLLKHM